MTERITYEQVQRAMQTMPDLVDVIRWLRPQIEDLGREGKMAVCDHLTANTVGLAWDRGN